MNSIKRILLFLCVCNIFFMFACKEKNGGEFTHTMSVDISEVSLLPGETVEVRVTLSPYMQECSELKWTSSDEGTAVAEQTGVVNDTIVGRIKALAPGETMITIEAPAGGYGKAVVKVTVAKRPLTEHTFAEKLAEGENYTSERLMTYSVPAEYPQEGAPLFNVSINEHYTGVYTDVNGWKKLVSFAYFDFAPGEAVDVVITAAKDFDTYKILPESSHIVSTRDGNNIRFTLTEADKNLSVVFDNNYRGNTFHLFANAIDVDAPTEATGNLIYFGPGYHDLQKTHGGRLTTGNKDVYIAGGAVVDGHISVNGNGNRVFGHGIVMKTTPGDLVIIANYSRSTTFEGFIACSHRNGGWTVGMHEAADVKVQNVKVVSTRYASTDGFDIVNSRNVELKNVFIRSCDDAIAIKGLIDRKPSLCPANENMLFEGLQIWNDCNNAMGLGAETRAKHYDNIHFKNIDVIFSYDDLTHHGNLDERSVMNICCLEGTYFRNITWEDIRVNQCERLICLTFKDNFWFGSIQGDQSTEGGIDGVTFKNITSSSTSGARIANEILLNGWYSPGTPTKTIKNISFDNVIVQGERVADEHNKHIKTNNTPERALVTDLHFK